MNRGKQGVITKGYVPAAFRQGNDPLDWPEETGLSSVMLTDEYGVLRSQTRNLDENVVNGHREALLTQLEQRTSLRQKASAETLLSDLGAMGFSWRDVARMVSVSVPAVQKWRRGETATGENVRKLARILALCDLVHQRFHVEHPAAWLEIPVLDGVLVNPMDLYIAGRADLVLELASGHPNVRHLLDEFDTDWRDHYATEYEVHIDGDGVPALQERA